MEVNDELAVLRRAIPAAIDAIAVGGRVVVESYHSLEDRAGQAGVHAGLRSTVPEDLPFVPEGSEPALRLVTRGAEKADQAEIEENPRAASVRLRAIERVSNDRGVAYMSSSRPPAAIARRSPRIAEAAVERARLTVVPRRRTRAARMPFVMLVSLVLLGGRDRAAAVQHLDAAGVVRDHRARGAGDHADRPRADAADGARRAARPPARRRAGPGDGPGAAAADPASLRLSDGKVLGEPCAAPARSTACGSQAAAARQAGRAEPAGPRSCTIAVGSADARPRLGRATAGSDGRNDAQQQPRRRALRPEIPVRPTRPLARAGRSRPRGSLRGSPLFRLRFGFLVIAMVLSVFGARLVQLQGVDPKAYAAMAAAEGMVEVELPADARRHPGPQRRAAGRLGRRDDGGRRPAHDRRPGARAREVPGQPARRRLLHDPAAAARGGEPVRVHRPPGARPRWPPRWSRRRTRRATRASTPDATRSATTRPATSPPT